MPRTHPTHRADLLALVTVLVLLTGVACGGSTTRSSSDPDTDRSTSTSASTGTITVSAAASLTDVFTELGQTFEAQHPGTTIRFSFGSSATLAQQIIDGAPADVFASADESNMEKVNDAGLITMEPVPFATNKLTIVVKKGNPLGIRTLEDLLGVATVSLCAETAPCGKFAAQILDNAGVTLPESKVTRGQDARATLTAVSDGDADAGIVYETDAGVVSVTDSADAPGATDIDAVDVVLIPAAVNVTTTYPVAVLSESGSTPLAEAWIAFLTGPAARATLLLHGFGTP